MGDSNNDSRPNIFHLRIRIEKVYAPSTHLERPLLDFINCSPACSKQLDDCCSIFTMPDSWHFTGVDSEAPGAMSWLDT